MQRRIVCAAIKSIDGHIICGARHYDPLMRAAIKTSTVDWKKADQGFVDQRGEYLTREEAWPIAEAAGQIIRRVGGDGERLYSENLY